MEKAIGRRDMFVLAWLAGLLLVLAQGAAQRELSGAPPDPRWLLEWRAVPILIWAAASPWILDLGARFPARGGAVVRDLVLHAGVAGAWVYVSNVLMRLPGVAGGDSWTTLPGDALDGAVAYGPGAVALYAALALIGRAVAGEERGDAAGAASLAPSSASESEAAPAPLALREGHHIHLVPRREVRWVEADSDHVRVHAAERSFRVRGTMRSFERELAADGFLRIHRSALVHPRAVCEIQPYFHGDYVAVLHDGTELRIPRTRRRAIDALLALPPLAGG